MSKLDLRKELKQYYTAKKKPEILDVPPGKFLTIIGKGDPNGEEYQNALQALYGLSYTLKFKSKADGRDFTVMALEGLWWIDEGVFDLENPAPRGTWNWKSMIRQPDFITEEIVEEAKLPVREKRGSTVDKVRLETFNEGLSAQILHRARARAISSKTLKNGRPRAISTKHSFSTARPTALYPLVTQSSSRTSKNTHPITEVKKLSINNESR